ncbi:MAG: ribonuclease H-like domain-containing protein [Lachnospiraceae bacterium]|nr:ribonuclease H-like domain-containing protein [Lachnospiraceae bacterium]MDY4970202.1 ribonuclease H-like domain-containing protein [Lachnospiraceae bacterium]
MITVDEAFTPEKFYPGICPQNRKMLFFDIETTGFSREHHMIYLIGAAAFRNGQWKLCQWFAQEPQEEPDVIRAFLDFSADYDTLIHFNGQRFDLPFTRARAEFHQIPWTLEFDESIDLMNLIKPYRALCHLDNCRQKSIEKLLGLSSREDVMTGGELIPVYNRYVHKKDSRSLQLLLLHNADDVRGMTGLTLAAQWPDFFHSRFCFTHQDTTEQGIVLHFENADGFRMPVLLQADLEYWQLCAGGSTLSLGIHFVEGELKHFYKNYKDYYYLPDEDMVVHKSVAAFVDPSHRRKATRQNCYVKRKGRFLPQPSPLITPEFQQNPGDKLTCFLYDTPDAGPADSTFANNDQPDKTPAEIYLREVLKRCIKDC